MVNGDGPSVGQVMAAHPGIDMMSFTGSTRAGIIVAKTAADTVKRVAQELGGKSRQHHPADADLELAVRKGVEPASSNSGQSCNAPTRMLVPRDGTTRRWPWRSGGRGAQGRRPQAPRAPGSGRWSASPVRQDPAPDRGGHPRGRRRW
jgi:hypothetical protein